MGKALLRLVALFTPFMLAACGEGWEAQRTDKISPYGNMRTAGSGVAYVRAKMMPEKELKTEPVMEEQTEEEIKAEPEPVLDAEEIFTEAQSKGSASKENLKVDNAKKEEHSSNTYGSESDDEIKSTSVEKSSDLSVPELSAEEYIAHAPKEIEIPRIVISQIEPASGALDATIEQEAQVSSMNETVQVYENKVVQPKKEIVVPKRDFIDLRSKGEENLDEIYNDPFVNSF